MKTRLSRFGILLLIALSFLSPQINAAETSPLTLSKWKILFDANRGQVTVHLRATSLSKILRVTLAYRIEKAAEQSLPMRYFGGDSDTWIATFPQPLIAGEKLTLRAIAEDEAGNQEASDFPANPYRVASDMTPPSLSGWKIMTSPASGKMTVTLSATDDTRVERVTLLYSIGDPIFDRNRTFHYVGGPQSLWSLTLPEKLKDGDRVYLKATATDPDAHITTVGYPDNPYFIARDTTSPVISDWKITLNPKNGKMTVQVMASDASGVERVGLSYRLGEEERGLTRPMTFAGGNSKTWTTTLPDPFINGQQVYLRSTSEDINSPANTGFTDYPANPFVVSNVLTPTVWTTAITLNPEKSPRNGIVKGKGTLVGKGHGVLTYQWKWRNPEGAVENSALLATQMQGGAAIIPPYRLPTKTGGTYQAWIEVTHPKSLLSDKKPYVVTATTDRPLPSTRSHFQITPNAQTEKLTVQFQTSDPANVHQVDLNYGVDSPTYDRSQKMSSQGGLSETWTTTLPETTTPGQKFYLRAHAQNQQQQTRTTDYAENPYVVSYPDPQDTLSPQGTQPSQGTQRGPLVSSIQADVSPSEAGRKTAVFGKATLKGSGEGVATYRWRWRRPEGVMGESPRQTTPIRHGTGEIPPYRLPTEALGEYTAWVDVNSPTSLQSAPQRYLVKDHGLDLSDWEVEIDPETQKIAVRLKADEAKAVRLAYSKQASIYDQSIPMIQDEIHPEYWMATLPQPVSEGQKIYLRADARDHRQPENAIAREFEFNPYQVAFGKEKPVFGVTVITHGFPLCGKINLSQCVGLPTWAKAMGMAILNRAGSGKLWHFQYGTDTLHDRTPKMSSPPPQAKFKESRFGEQVILVDWSEQANPLIPGAAEATGHALYALLMGEGIGNPERFVGPVGRQRALHFIGHGPGTVVNSEAIRRLGAWEEIRVEQMTLLDPYDWDSKTLKMDSATHQAALLPDVRIWSNVTRVDTYYHEKGGDPVINPQGRPVPGSQRGTSGGDQGLDLSDLNGFYNAGLYNPHERVHTFYHGTIDPAATEVDGEAIQQGWYLGKREALGYAYSRIGGRKHLKDFSRDCRIPPSHSKPLQKCNGHKESRGDNQDLQIQPLKEFSQEDALAQRLFNSDFLAAQGVTLPGFKTPVHVKTLIPGKGVVPLIAGDTLSTHLTYLPVLPSSALLLTLKATPPPSVLSSQGTQASQAMAPRLFISRNNALITEIPVIVPDLKTTPAPTEFRYDLSAFQGQSVSIKIGLTGQGPMQISEPHLVAAAPPQKASPTPSPARPARPEKLKKE